MNQYKLLKLTHETPHKINAVKFSNSIIPFDPNNTDYQLFKNYLLQGGEVLNWEDISLTSEEIQDLLDQLP